MKKIALLSIIIVFVASCQSAPVSNPTSAPMPTNTVISVTATSTIEPTFTPIPPTVTTESYQDYVQASENVFPLKGIEPGLVDFVCTADFSNPVRKDFTTPDGTVTKLWVSCEDGGQTFLTGLFLVGQKVRYWAMSNAPSESQEGQIYSDKYIQAQYEKMLEILKITGKTKVRIIGGSHSEILLKLSDPMPSVFSTVDWDESFLKFAETGNYNLLPKIPGLDGYLLYAIRIEVVK